jgi:hypothetical protein
LRVFHFESAHWTDWTGIFKFVVRVSRQTRRQIFRDGRAAYRASFANTVGKLNLFRAKLNLFWHDELERLQRRIVLRSLILQRVFFAYWLATPVSFAGGGWEAARITKLSFTNQARLIFEFEWSGSNGFMSGGQYRKLVFEYHNWPSASHQWFVNWLPWAKSNEKLYPLSEMAACQNFLLEAYKNGNEVLIGQMGTVPFKPSESVREAGIVPFAKVVHEDGKDACLLFAAPI